MKSLEVGGHKVPWDNILRVELTFRQKCRLLVGKREWLLVKRRLKGAGVRLFVVEIR